MLSKKGTAMLRRFLATLVFPACIAASAGAAEVRPDALVEKGALTYGVAATFAPFEFQRNGQLTGFDVDMIEALAAKMKLKTNPMNMEFKGLIPALQGGRLDVINSAMYMNAQRAEQVDFIPYL